LRGGDRNLLVLKRAKAQGFAKTIDTDSQDLGRNAGGGGLEPFSIIIEKAEILGADAHLEILQMPERPSIARFRSIDGNVPRPAGSLYSFHTPLGAENSDPALGYSPPGRSFFDVHILHWLAS
jgi:hypothetical protein